MNSGALKSQIESGLSAMQADGILYVENSVAVTPEGKSHLVSWPRSRNAVGLGMGDATLAQFQALLDAREYSAVLIDGSLVQLTYKITDGAVVYHRLCFYPCPVEVDPDLFSAGEVGEVVEMCGASGDWRSSVRLVAPIRFDFSPALADANHPASHLTVNRTSCRVPVSAPLTVARFLNFVARHFYQERWLKGGAVRQLTDPPLPACLTADDQTAMHFSCP